MNVFNELLCVRRSGYYVLSGLLTAGNTLTLSQIRERLHYILKKKNCDVNDSDNFETIMFYT